MSNIIKVIFVFCFTGSISAQVVVPEGFEVEQIISFSISGELGFAILDENRLIVISQSGRIQVASKDRRTGIADLKDNLLVSISEDPLSQHQCPGHQWLFLQLQV